MQQKGLKHICSTCKYYKERKLNSNCISYFYYKNKLKGKKSCMYWTPVFIK